MSNTTKTCPKCGGRAIDSRQTSEHGTLHASAHHLRHHPLLAALGLAAVGISKLLPRTYRCSGCGHSFRS